MPATAGPWSAQSQHAGPPAALLSRAMEQHEPMPGTRLAGVRLDIPGPIPVRLSPAPEVSARLPSRPRSRRAHAAGGSHGVGSTPNMRHSYTRFASG
ncbi:acyl-CoA thioesterase domain-containing protein [Calidifontibacter indicus]|uniref:acyl-CoA thioesterase domain-containing protein n=1 Tax=Calidifontibacter indicus TaxID=419650 RepID=UPI00319E3F88